MMSDDQLLDVFALDDEVGEPAPEYGDFWEESPEEELYY